MLTFDFSTWLESNCIKVCKELELIIEKWREINRERTLNAILDLQDLSSLSGDTLDYLEEFNNTTNNESVFACYMLVRTAKSLYLSNNGCEKETKWIENMLNKRELTGLTDSTLHFTYWILRNKLFMFRADMFSTTSSNTKRVELEDVCKKINKNYGEDRLILSLDLPGNSVVFSLENWITEKIEKLVDELLSEIKEVI